MYDLNAMHIFVKVVEAEGFTAAAKILDIPKSKVSRVISQLEDELQTRLLERTTRHVRLTEAGRIFYQYCQRIMSEAEQAENAIHAMSENAAGLLRISASISLGQHLLAPALSQFIERYPDIDIDLELTNRRVDLIEENFDAVIRVGELPNSSLISKRIGHSNLYFYASKQYIKTHGHPTHPNELKNYKVLGMTRALGNNQIKLIDESKNIYTAKIDYPIKVNDFPTLLQLAKDNVGITVLPHFMCSNENTLLRVLTAWEIPAVPIYLIYPSHRGATPKLRVFIDFINETISPGL